MTKLKCTICGNTDNFYRHATVRYDFSTYDKMVDESHPEFTEWVTSISCGNCYDETVEETEEDDDGLKTN